MPFIKNEYTFAFDKTREDIQSGIYRSLEEALKDPESLETKMVNTLQLENWEKKDLLLQLLLQHVLKQQREEKRLESKLETKLIKEEAQKLAVESYNEAISEEHQAVSKQRKQTAKAVAELHREMKARVSNINRLDETLYDYEMKKAAVEEKIAALDEEILPLENAWRETIEKTADKFIHDNFTLNDQGRLVTTTNPAIELSKDAPKVIKKVFTNAKSPAEMQIHNPTLIDHPERVPIIENVRKEIHLARKIDKIVDPEVKKEANKSRQIFVKRIVLDDAGNPVYEVDPATGKKKVKTERVPLDAITEKLKDAQATNETRTTYAQDENAQDAVRRTKVNNAQLVCVGDVCFLRDNVIATSVSDSAKPVNESQEQQQLVKNLLKKGEQKRPLVNERDGYIDRIESTKKEIKEEKAAVDTAYVQLGEMHENLQTAPPMKAEATADQRLIDKNVKAEEQSRPTKRS